MAAQVQRMFVVPPVRQDFIFGVLRRTYNGMRNDTVEFARSKLFPIAPPPSAEPERAWQPTAARYEVLLPNAMPDVLVDPKLLTETYEKEAKPRQTDLAIVVKLVLPAKSAIHVVWELAREFARQSFVVELGLPAVLVLHAPGLSGMRNANPMHVHAIVLARQYENGFTEYSTIAHDAAHEPLAAKWGRMRGD